MPHSAERTRPMRMKCLHSYLGLAGLANRVGRTVRKPCEKEQRRAVHVRHDLYRESPDQDLRRGRGGGARCAASTSTLGRGVSRDARPVRRGKSTLLNILGGLDMPTAAGLFFMDEELTSFDDRGLTRYRRRPCRLRVPVLQSRPEPDGKGERCAGHRDIQAAHGAGGGAGNRRA